MLPQRLDEIMKNHRAAKARHAYLKETAKTLERWVSICRGEMVNDMLSMSQALTGMPHGSGIGDPTGRLGIDIASGNVSTFVKQAETELAEVYAEINRLEGEIRTVEIVLEALGDREREVLVFKIIDDRGWADTVNQMNALHNNSYSKRTLQRLLDRALEKAYEIVK